MAQFSQRYIRSIIEEVWEQAGDAADSFLDALKICRSGKWQQTSTGFLVQSSSGAGYSTSFHIPMSPSDPNGMTPATLQELFQHVIENYRLVKASGLDEGTAGNQPFLDALLDYFPTIKGKTNNWMFLNP